MSQSCTNKSMNADVVSLPDNVNPSTFPAKLWRLVNNPENTSICWDHLGETILINEELFKSQILSPSLPVSDNPDCFKTTKFCSFVRQLNLYGFKKNIRTVRVNLPFENGTYHCFYHKNFNRTHPELIADLKRLTADNKAKLSAGLKVSHRPWTRRSGSDECKNKKVTSVVAPTLLYCPDKAPATTTNNSTPVYPLYLMNSSTNSTALPGIPVSVNQQNAEAAPCSGPVHIQQSFPTYPNHAIPNFTSYDPHSTQDPPGLFSPGFPYYHANILTSHMAGSGLQFRPFAPYHCYQIPENLPFPTGSLSVKLPNSETAATGFNHINQEITTDNFPSHDTHSMDPGCSKSAEVLDLKLEDSSHFDTSMAPNNSTTTPTMQIPIC